MKFIESCIATISTTENWQNFLPYRDDKKM